MLSSNIDYDKLFNDINNNPNFIQNVAKKLDNDNSQKLYNELKLKFVNPRYLKDYINNDDKEYWQKLFTDNPNILYSIIPSVGQIICKKPYMGGKSIIKVALYLILFINVELII